MKNALKSSTGGLAAERGKRRRKPAKHHGPVTGQHLWQVMEKHDRPTALTDALMPGDAPPWVKVLVAKWLQQLQPGVKIRPGMESDPAFLGVQTARAVVARKLGDGEVELTSKVQRDLEAFVKSRRLTKTVIREAAQRMEDDVAQQSACADEVMALVTRMPVQDQDRFMRAYNKALKFGIEYLDPTRVPVEHKIVNLLFFSWRRIARLETVTQVHQFVQSVLAKDNVIISRERIARFCTRIGLRLKSRGRPRKRENRTKAP